MQRLANTENSESSKSEKFWNRVIYGFLWLGVCLAITAGIVAVRDPIKYDEGYKAGYEAALGEREDVRSQSYNEGLEDGRELGYESGKDAGYESGYDEGYSDGHSKGYDEGYETGRADEAEDQSYSANTYDTGTYDTSTYDTGTYDTGTYDTGTYDTNTYDTWTPPTDRWVPSWVDPDQTVYVSNRSHTIHSIHNCSGMKNYFEMTFWRAVDEGYDFCMNCW